MKYAIVGAGRMTKAVLRDLLRHPDTEIVRLGDVDPERANALAGVFRDKRIIPSRLDARDPNQLDPFLEGTDVCVSAASYSVNLEVTRACIRAKTHMVDMGGNNSVVNAQKALSDDAERAGVTIVPDMGLAPGLADVLGGSFAEELDTVHEIRLRVGGLPQNPRPPLNYGLIFSVEGLINEYVEPCLVIRNGKKQVVEPLTDVEEIFFPEPFGRLEAFNTSGGSSNLPDMFEGKLRELDYKTIRYPGHCEKMRTILELGLMSHGPIKVDGVDVSPRRVLETLIEMTVPHIEDDVTLMRCWAIGEKDARPVRIEYEMIDYASEGLTSMMKTTGFPVSVTARMLADGRISKRGVLLPAECVPVSDMIRELAELGVRIEKRVIV
ncbi:MAG: saccharopine dehydrogenase C-terminal domain-containing protein [candidate division WOR-3 bacterium]